MYSEFASRLTAKVSEFKVGNGLESDRYWLSPVKKVSFHHSIFDSTHGPLIHSRAIDKVKRHVDDAVSRGAQILVGGKKLNGNFFAPTVLSEVPHDAQLCGEETFGPVAALIKFETESEVIRMANDTDYGLAGYFYSRDVGRVWRVAEALEVGMVGTNTGMISQAVIPFGGVKESGLGILPVTTLRNSLDLRVSRARR